MLRFKNINESVENKDTYKPSNLVHDLCVCMCLLNNKFLDNILDRGVRARYQENTHVFINDLKHLLVVKNRLHLGKFENGKCVEDTETSKLTRLFDSLKFTIDDDWQILVDARNAARNIIDKIIPDDKLSDEMIAAIYWLGPNIEEEYQEDIVLELKDGRQFSFFLNKNVTLYKTASYNKFADELIGNEFEKMFGPQYIVKWNHLTKRWIEIIYTNANKNIHSEDFLDKL